MRLVIAVSLSLLIMASGVARADAENGRSVYAARGCIGCHGVDGVSRAPAYPTLQGRSAGFILQSLTEFRAGIRTGTVMNAMAAGLSDTEIRDLAEYLGGL